MRLLYSHDLFLQQRLSYPIRIVVIQVSAEMKMAVYDTRHQGLTCAVDYLKVIKERRHVIVSFTGIYESTIIDHYE